MTTTTRIRTTRIYYDGDGSTVDFTIPFDYLAKRFVQVYIDNELQKGGASSDKSAAYYFANATTIRFNTAPLTGTQVLIKRFTDATDRIVTFQDASVLRASDLNAAQVQTIHIAEEGRDIIDDALIVDTDGNWDARNRRIVNLADPIDPQDAVTYKVYKEDAEGAYQAAIEAKEAAAQAKADAEEVAANTEEVAANTALVLEAQADVTTKHDRVVELAAQIEQRAQEVLQSFEEARQYVDEAKQIVLDTKDYIEEIVNNNVVQSGLACARSTWTLTEDIPKGTVIKLEGNPTYVVGRKHLFISYDGIVMSPTFYNEIGEFNTTSTQVSFNFDLFKGQELTAWVVTLGNSDSEIYGRITDIESNVTEAQTNITNLQEADVAINSEITALKETDTTSIARIEALETKDTEVDKELESLKATDATFTQEITGLKDTDSGLRTDVDYLLAHIGGDSGEIVISDCYKTVTVNGTQISATIPEDTFSINAGDNIELTVDAQQKSFSISAVIPEVPLETIVVSDISAVPSTLKVGGIALVKEGYTTE